MAFESAWLQRQARVRRDLWRGVEAQHRVATLRLVDDLAEQELLEDLLEASKPKLPAGSAASHWLLFTPFRYVSDWPSRFRAAGDAGAWYGADEPGTVAAELAWWRWKFLMDSPALQDEALVTEHTFFRARFEGTEIDLTAAPWVSQREAWRNPQDYSACHELAARARALATPVQSIRYESARREAATCQVVFDVLGLTLPKSYPQQTWICKTSREVVLFSHDKDRLQFNMGG